MPELDHMYAGDELKLSKYPHLKHIVQTGFSKIRGTNMFKDVAVSWADVVMTIGSGRGRANIQAGSGQGRTRAGLG
jgi:hypothetical protein